jgi:hypothetical protein
MLLYKLTDSGGQTRNTQWGVDVTHSANYNSQPVLCTDGVIHAYRTLEQMALFCHSHVGFSRPDVGILWEAESIVCVEDAYKVGCRELTTLHVIPFPSVNLLVYPRFAVLCAVEYYKEHGLSGHFSVNEHRFDGAEFMEWATRFLSTKEHGKDFLNNTVYLHHKMPDFVDNHIAIIKEAVWCAVGALNWKYSLNTGVLPYLNNSEIKSMSTDVSIGAKLTIDQIAKITDQAFDFDYIP